MSESLFSRIIMQWLCTNLVCILRNQIVRGALSVAVCINALLVWGCFLSTAAVSLKPLIIGWNIFLT